MTHPSSVSVALCTFNGGAHLEEQLDSIESQTRPVDEVIVGDDGSSDHTLSIIGRFAARSATPVRVLRPTGRLGVTANFERTIAACTHQLIALSDQDDIWESNRVQTQLESLENRPRTLFLFSDADLVDEGGEPLARSMFESIRFGLDERNAIRAGEAFPTLLRRNVATGATTMIRRQLFDIASPFPTQWVHDEWLGIVGAAIGHVDFDDLSLIRYRQHESNVIGASDPSLGFRVRRVLTPRGGRNVQLAEKFAVLATRLAQLGDLVPATFQAAAGQKAAFEKRRSDLPSSRRRRIVGVAREALRGDYGRFASQRSLDIVRDLMQPA